MHVRSMMHDHIIVETDNEGKMTHPLTNFRYFIRCGTMSPPSRFLRFSS